MTLRTLIPAAFLALGLGTAAAPALAQGTRTVHVMGLSFQQADAPRPIPSTPRYTSGHRGRAR